MPPLNCSGIGVVDYFSMTLLCSKLLFLKSDLLLLLLVSSAWTIDVIQLPMFTFDGVYMFELHTELCISVFLLEELLEKPFNFS